MAGNDGARKKPRIILAVIDGRAFPRRATSLMLEKLSDFSVSAFASPPEALASGQAFDVYLLTNPDHAEALRPTPLILLAEECSTDTVSRAFAMGICGYVPTTTAPEVVVEIIRLVKCGGTYTPPLVANGHNRGPLTARQLDVLQQLRLGKSNKLIAYALSVSESTVKHHVGELIKRLGATNRTEVACRAPQQ